jgi:hypothetical protein
VRAQVFDAWDRHDQLGGDAKGLKVGLHLRIDRRHGGCESVDLIELKAQQEAMMLGPRPRRASCCFCGDALTRRSARLASLTGLLSPAIRASIIARPLLPITSASTESNLMLASCSQPAWAVRLEKI